MVTYFNETDLRQFGEFCKSRKGDIDLLFNNWMASKLNDRLFYESVKRKPRKDVALIVKDEKSGTIQMAKYKTNYDSAWTDRNFYYSIETNEHIRNVTHWCYASAFFKRK